MIDKRLRCSLISFSLNALIGILWTFVFCCFFYRNEQSFKLMLIVGFLVGILFNQVINYLSTLLIVKRRIYVYIIQLVVFFLLFQNDYPTNIYFDVFPVFNFFIEYYMSKRYNWSEHKRS